MKIITKVAIFIIVAGALLYACARYSSVDENEGGKDKSGETNMRAAAASDEGSEIQRLRYPGYNPKYDDTKEEYVLENLRVTHRSFITNLYSLAACLTNYFFGFYPRTIEEMYEKGLVPYIIAGEDYDFVKYRLSLGFTADPGSSEPDGPDKIRFRERVNFDKADPAVIMQYKGELMRRSIGDVCGLPSLYSYASDEVLVPGITDCKANLSADWELCEAFWTNPYTGEPMKGVSSENPSPGEFSCKVTDFNSLSDYYEVQFYVE